MARTHNEELRRALLDLVAAKSTIRAAAARVGVSYSTATRWVQKSRTRTASKPAFLQLVREAPEAPIIVRVANAEIAVRRGVDLELLQMVVRALSVAP